MNFQELKAIGLANPKGKIVSSDPKGNDRYNTGSWAGTDCNRDFITDMLNAAVRLSSIPSYIIGKMDTIIPLFNIAYDSPLPEWTNLVALFKNGGNYWEGPNFIRYDVTADPGIVLLVGTEGDVVYIDTR